MQIKCSQYHDSDGLAVLMGDAAHSTSPSIGQGCNTSLADAAVLASLLLETVRGDAKSALFHLSHGPSFKYFSFGRPSLLKPSLVIGCFVVIRRSYCLRCHTFLNNADALALLPLESVRLYSSSFAFVCFTSCPLSRTGIR
jgi:hypothetical protein